MVAVMLNPASGMVTGVAQMAGLRVMQAVRVTAAADVIGLGAV